MYGAFRNSIGFLNDIPDHLYLDLDLSEFHLPHGRIAALREALEILLGHYVMSYDCHVSRRDLPPAKHLCAHYKGADLTRDQREILKKFEAVSQPLGVSFVVYQKPLRLFSDAPIACRGYKF